MTARAVVAALMLAISACAARPPIASLQTSPSSPSQEVRDLLANQAADWSRGDLEAFCLVYALDAVFVSPSGVTRGRQAVLARYRARYPDALAMGKLEVEPFDVRVLGQTASVALTWRIERGEESLQGTSLVVLTRGDEGWSIVQDASM